MKRILLLLSAALCTTSCVVQTTYIGKAYPATDAPELFFSWDDVTRDYETMGRITAAPQFFGTLEKAQEVIEQRAREKGADAVVFAVLIVMLLIRPAGLLGKNVSEKV